MIYRQSYPYKPNIRLDPHEQALRDVPQSVVDADFHKTPAERSRAEAVLMVFLVLAMILSACAAIWMIWTQVWE